MAAVRGGSGNIAEGFMRTFDPNAFGRSYARAEERSARVEERKKAKTDAQEEWNRRQVELDTKKAAELLARTTREDKRRTTQNLQTRFNSMVSQAPGREEKEFLTAIRPRFMAAKTEEARAAMLAPAYAKDGYKAKDVEAQQNRQLKLRREVALYNHRLLKRDQNVKWQAQDDITKNFESLRKIKRALNLDPDTAGYEAFTVTTMRHLKSLMADSLSKRPITQGVSGKYVDPVSIPEEKILDQLGMTPGVMSQYMFGVPPHLVPSDISRLPFRKGVTPHEMSWMMGNIEKNRRTKSGAFHRTTGTPRALIDAGVPYR